MIKLTPILLALGYGLLLYQFSAWRTRRALDRQSSELADPLLRHMAGQLATVLELDRLPVYIYEVAQINGLAAPDGRIFITRGFYNKFRLGEVSSAEMASVIAHELGHVALGHTRRRMIDFSGQNATRTALAMVLSRFIPFAGVWIANALMALVAARLSRADEYEADAYAAALLVKAGIGIAPQITLFEKLESLSQGGDMSAMPAWLLSHPKPAKRIAALRKLASAWGVATPAG